MPLDVAVATSSEGADGLVAGVTELLAVDCAEVPTVEVASTLKVYAVPLVRPVTSQLVAMLPDDRVVVHVPASVPSGP